MDFSFDLFKPHKTRPSKKVEAVVTVNPNGRIIFNKRATELLGSKYFCMLGYDANNQTLGILPLDDHETNSFPVRYAAKGAYIGAKKFFRHFDILPQQIVENSPFQHDQFIGINL